jgi:hypothetical protein
MAQKNLNLKHFVVVVVGELTNSGSAEVSVLFSTTTTTTSFCFVALVPTSYLVE